MSGIPFRSARRTFVLGAAAGLVLAPGTLLAALTPTPRSTRGPFYPDRLPLDRDNDLVHVADGAAPARGTITDIAGRVLDPGGAPVDGAEIEIWQADFHGRYIHTRDAGRGETDPNFQGYGRTMSAADGGYRFRTIRPVPYSGRAPHIHFAVRAPGFGELVTQMYVAGEEQNARDFLYRRLGSDAAREAVTVTLAPAAGDADLAGRFDIVLGA